MDLTPVLKLNLPAFAFEPWDDEVNDNFDVLDAFVGSVVGFSNYAGLWINDHAYSVGQQVIDTLDSSFWSCNVSHTSAAAPTTFMVDRTNHPTYWVLKQNSAKQYADEAAQSAAAAAQSAADALAAYNAIMPDAPRNGTLYGRIDGLWRPAVPLDSPFFTGDPRAPTPPLSDNDNSLATTAFVKGIVGTSAAFVTIGESPPSSPSIGSLWWDDIGGQLYVYYYDSNSYQWVAVNSATGGMGTGFMPIVGGVFTGPVSMTTGNLTLSSAAITANLHAATKQYVDNTVNNKSYPYLPLAGGTVAGPTAFSSTLTVGSTLTVSGAGNFTGNLATSGVMSVAQAVPSGMAGGYLNAYDIILNNALGWNVYYNANTTQWTRRATGNGFLLHDDTSQGTPALNLFGVAHAGAGTTAGLNHLVQFQLGTTVFMNTIDVRGTVWAGNLAGQFGLQNFGGGYYGIRFNSNGWRLQWYSGDGTLQLIGGPPDYVQWVIDQYGNQTTRGYVVAPHLYSDGGVSFSINNSREYQAYTDGSGNHILQYRAGYYDRWWSAGGKTEWVRDNAAVMTLDGGSLSVTGNMSASGSMYSNYIQSNGNVHAVGAHTGGTVSITGNVNCNAVFAPSGVYIGGDTNYGLYRQDGANQKVLQFSANWYWQYIISTGQMSWVKNGSTQWVMHPDYVGPYLYLCYNNIGAVGGHGIYNMDAFALLSAGAPLTDASSKLAQLTAAVHDSRIMLRGNVPEIMQEVETEGGMVRATDVMGLVTLLVAAFKEQQARIAALEAR